MRKIIIGKNEKLQSKIAIIEKNIENSNEMALLMNELRKKKISFEELLNKLKEIGITEDDLNLDNYFINLSVFEENRYVKNINLNGITYGEYFSKANIIKKKEVFGTDSIIKNDMKKIPIIKAFEDGDYYYYSLQNRRCQWMSLAPFEVHTQEIYLEKMTGNVMIIGIGLGYFAYMCSLRDEVKKITLVDNSSEIIGLFQTKILPQFEHKEKIEILHSNGEEVFENALTEYDSIFVDVWLGATDNEGIPIYMDFKRMELKSQNKKAKVFYWIEDEMVYGIKLKFWNYIMLRNRGNYEDVKDYYMRTPIMPEIFRAVFPDKPDFRDFESVLKFERIFEKMGVREINSIEELEKLENKLDELVNECILHEKIEPIVKLVEIEEE